MQWPSALTTRTAFNRQHNKYKYCSEVLLNGTTSPHVFSKMLTKALHHRRRTNLQVHCAFHLRSLEHQDRYRTGAFRRAREARPGRPPAEGRYQHAASGRSRHSKKPVSQVCGEGGAARCVHHRCAPTCGNGTEAQVRLIPASRRCVWSA